MGSGSSISNKLPGAPRLLQATRCVARLCTTIPHPSWDSSDPETPFRHFCGLGPLLIPGNPEIFNEQGSPLGLFRPFCTLQSSLRGGFGKACRCLLILQLGAGSAELPKTTRPVLCLSSLCVSVLWYEQGTPRSLCAGSCSLVGEEGRPQARTADSRASQCLSAVGTWDVWGALGRRSPE